MNLLFKISCNVRTEPGHTGWSHLSSGSFKIIDKTHITVFYSLHIFYSANTDFSGDYASALIWLLSALLPVEFSSGITHFHSPYVFPTVVCQSRSVPSSLPLAYSSPSGENRTQCTGPKWPLKDSGEWKENPTSFSTLLHHNISQHYNTMRILLPDFVRSGVCLPISTPVV